MSSNSNIDRGKTCGQTNSSDHSSHSDYRFIIPVRNWYDALISGYNYHKTGRECWLNYAGRPYRKIMTQKKCNPDVNSNKGNIGCRGDQYARVMNATSELLSKEKKIVRQNESSISRYDFKILGSNGVNDQSILQPMPVARLPKANNRSICKYMKDEEEDDGLLMFTEYMLTLWLRPLYEYVTSIPELYQLGNNGEYLLRETISKTNISSRKNSGKALLVCYENLIQDIDLTAKHATRFMFPNMGYDIDKNAKITSSKTASVKGRDGNGTIALGDVASVTTGAANIVSNENFIVTGVDNNITSDTAPSVIEGSRGERQKGHVRPGSLVTERSRGKRQKRHVGPGSRRHRPKSCAEKIEEWKQQGNKTYKGSHASNHDTALRERLRNKIMSFDEHYYGGYISRANDFFKCASSI
eukprot:CAMPEP_0194353274 /NCGR_PEP_ID=MMETSP0174-20130528/1601_1 /TAXON_ID=216777 /ORGANISM="Proboscia alata, Strain PI-D3" /LENGTH=412 /DNA_ID=CAMNT_0039121733 /DNA_START=436 /DNA_END=1674 /DNA_ORIENTATION=+